MKVLLLLTGALTLIASTSQKQNNISAQLKNQNEKLKQVVLTKNLDLLDEVYASDAYYLSPGEKPAKGLSAIKQHWKEGLPAMTDMHTQTLEITGDGKLVSEVGIVSTNIKLKDTTFIYRAKYNNVWVKQASGKYKLKVDIWNDL